MLVGDCVAFNKKRLGEVQRLIATSASAFRILFLLAEHMDGSNVARMSHTEFKMRLGLGRTTITEGIKLLKTNGILEVRKDGPFNVYVINDDIVQNGKEKKENYSAFGTKNLEAFVSEVCEELRI